MINLKERNTKQTVLRANGLCIITNLPGSDILMINCNNYNYNYLHYNVIGYLHNKHRVKVLLR